MFAGAARKLDAIKLPGGRHLHVARDENHLLQLQESQSDPEFRFTIHGSEDHISALKESKEHHEGLTNALRERHPEIVGEMERLQGQMEEISHDLHSITKHDVHLEANFSKFGYSANLRTHIRDKTDDDTSSTVIRVWKRPVIRQYFHKGLLWRASEEEKVASFELFVDLLYVGILALTGDRASEEPTAKSFLWFCIAMIPSYKLWTDVGVIVSWFETACLFGYTTNVFLAETVTYTQMVAFYLAARLFNAATLYVSQGVKGYDFKGDPY
ncbi:hypothetical protein ABW21_db0204023 [Orbilia brochopaga]|nr:hypothetical protein ABW21_db0204023 [Drechslerella brochopaga]